MLAVEAASPYTGLVVVASLAGGFAFLIVGLLVAILVDLPLARGVELALRRARPDGEKIGAVAHGAVSDTLSGMSDFAKSLKDLTVGTRLLVVGVLLVLVAAICAGADAIGDSPSAEAVATAPSPSP